MDNLYYTIEAINKSVATVEKCVNEKVTKTEIENRYNWLLKTIDEKQNVLEIDRNNRCDDLAKTINVNRNNNITSMRDLTNVNTELTTFFRM